MSGWGDTVVHEALHRLCEGEGAIFARDLTRKGYVYRLRVLDEEATSTAKAA